MLWMIVTALVTAAIIAVGLASFVGINRQEAARLAAQRQPTPEERSLQP